MQLNETLTILEKLKDGQFKYDFGLSMQGGVKKRTNWSPIHLIRTSSDIHNGSFLARIDYSEELIIEQLENGKHNSFMITFSLFSKDSMGPVLLMDIWFRSVTYLDNRIIFRDEKKDATLTIYL